MVTTSVMLFSVKWWHCVNFCCSEPCTTASQLDDHVRWLQFLVRPLLLEQWGLEAYGEIWYQGMVCNVQTFLPCRAATSSSALAG